MRPEQKRSNYRLLGLVGQGQFGQVFCAAHRQTGQLVALKRLDRARFSTQNFLRELRFLLSLRHPNIVTCHALEHTAAQRYLVMDYCEGGTLRQLMVDEHHLTLPYSLKLILDILTGLDHAHSRGIVHCDIKPENILLNVHTDGWTARISDFGIARFKQEISNRELCNTGSPAYMAPERFYGQYSPTSDLYSVGILLYELITGHRPFSGTPSELMSAHLNQLVPLSDQIPPPWQPILVTALQKLSARRFQSAPEMLAAIRTVIAREGSALVLNPPAQPWLQSRVELLTLAFRAQQGEPLDGPISVLAVGTDLYQAEGHRLVVRSLHDLSWPHTSVLSLDGTVQTILPDAQGSWVLTASALYHLPPSDALQPELLPLVKLSQAVGAIAPHGDGLVLWADGAVTFWPTPSATPPVPPVPVPLAHTGLSHPQLVALDRRHVAVVRSVPLPNSLGRISRKDAPHSPELLGTSIQVLSQRGRAIAALVLPLHLGQVMATRTPYQLLATDRDVPQSVLLIDLKPYRIRRWGLAITPSFLLVTLWGFIVATTQGTVVFLDQEGRQIGRTEVPQPITAMTIAPNHHLLIATWDGQQGELFTVALPELDLDLVF